MEPISKPSLTPIMYYGLSFLLPLLSLLLLCPNRSEASTILSVPEELETIPVYTLWLGGADGRQPYDKAVVWLALEKSRKQYGDFELRSYSRALNFERERIESTRRESYQIHIAPYYSVTQAREKAFIRVKEPIIKGLLGYRRLIIRAQDKAKFANISTAKQLSTVKAGQGVRWPDVAILRNNGIEVVEALEFNSLFGMLNKQRFDFIPLGANEVDASLRAAQKYYPELILEPNIVLHFPMSIFLFVSVANPELAERLEYGLKIAKADGSFDSLFTLHFHHVVTAMDSYETRLIRLNNTTVSAEKSPKTPQLLHYFSGQPRP